ncbi:MAG: hypothetical protein ABIG61_11915 [Planctomycetota bacterium]
MTLTYQKNRAIAALVVIILLTANTGAVTTGITRHCTYADFLKGTAQDVILSSEGTITLAREHHILADDINDVWTINSIVISPDGDIYLGTSPNGLIFRYEKNNLTRIYPADERTTDINEPNQPVSDEAVTNEHIFAMTLDARGRLLAGVSGRNCKVLRFENDQAQIIFEPNQADYIFEIIRDTDGNIYLATGPKGIIYRLEPETKKSSIVYTAKDKNILSLAIDRNEPHFIYAGADQRGLIYRINTKNSTASIVYDSDREEITDLLIDDQQNLYAAATSTGTEKTRIQDSSAASSGHGRPEPESQTPPQSTDTLKLETPNTAPVKSESEPKPPKQPPKRTDAAPGASAIYKIDKNGFVTKVFEQKALFFDLVFQQQDILVGTGNKAQLYALRPDTEQSRIAYEDTQASQITALAVRDSQVYLGTANPARLIKLEKSFAKQGSFESELIDASQPALWGKLHIDADIPRQCEVLVSARSSNVSDINDPAFSSWTKDTRITAPVDLLCPTGRFCQYRLTLKTKHSDHSPLIREVTVANTIPNLAPRVTAVSLARVTAPGKQGVFKVTCKADDDNNDKLIYQIDFRKLPRETWIKIKDKLEDAEFEWDTKTVEDGRYEIRVLASDERNNTPAASLTGSRISDPVVVDNTAPVITSAQITAKKTELTVKLTVADKLSIIGTVHYTINGSNEWIAAIPDDSVYDTTTENFLITIQELPAGPHVIAIKAADCLENTVYKSYDFTITGD